MKRFFCYSVSLAVLGAATSPAHASDLLSVTKGEELFFEHLQAAVLTCNTNWFATNLDYPITIKVGASTKVLARASDLNPWAPAIFDRQLQKKVQQQSPRFLVKNWQGVSVADGAFWFSEAPAVKKGRKSGCKVIGMNLPAKETWVSNIVAG